MYIYIYIYGNIVLSLQASRKYRRSWSRWCLKYLSWFMTRLFPMIDWPIPRGGCSTCQPLVTATGRVLGGGHGSGGESDSRTTWHVLQAVTMDWRSPKTGAKPWVGFLIIHAAASWIAGCPPKWPNRCRKFKSKILHLLPQKNEVDSFSFELIYVLYSCSYSMIVLWFPNSEYGWIWH